MTSERLWGYWHAFDHPVSLWIAGATALALLAATTAIVFLSALGMLAPAFRRELWQRTASWAVLAPLMMAPILLGAAKPAHILTSTATVRRLVNMTALAVVDANHLRT